MNRTAYVSADRQRERERNVIYSLYADCRQNNKMDGKSGYGAISDLNEKKKKTEEKVKTWVKETRQHTIINYYHYYYSNY